MAGHTRLPTFSMKKTSLACQGKPWSERWTSSASRWQAWPVVMARDGTVWYFGEISQEFDEGELVSLEGSWKAGRDGAKPGIVMLADPRAGVTYRQEWALGNAEDAAEVLETGASASTPGASCEGTCVVTRDFTPISPGAEEHKYYAPGVGLILEVNPETGDRVELVALR